MELINRSDARKEKIDAEKAWDMLSGATAVYIGKGKKVLRFEPGPETRDDMVKAAMGRSGNLRAPAVKTKNAFFIGFNEEIYTHL